MMKLRWFILIWRVGPLNDFKEPMMMANKTISRPRQKRPKNGNSKSPPIESEPLMVFRSIRYSFNPRWIEIVPEKCSAKEEGTRITALYGPVNGVVLYRFFIAVCKVHICQHPSSLIARQLFTRLPSAVKSFH